MTETRELYSDRVEMLRSADDGPMEIQARIVPYGETALIRNGDRERFEPGAFSESWDRAPLVTDHGTGALEVIGRMTALEERDDGAYGTFQISDVPNGRTAHTLLRDGALGAVSVGFIPGESTTDDDGTIVRKSVTLDHVALVQRGAYKGAETVSVRNEEGQDMADDQQAAETADQVEERAEDVGVELDNRTEDRLRSIETLIAGLENGAPVEKRMPPLGQVAQWVTDLQRRDMNAQRADIAEQELRALALDTTTSAAGLVPSYYSQEIISVVDPRRPFVNGLDTDPIGDYGMDVVYPEVTQKPTVGKQSSEGAEVSSQQMTVGTQTVTLDTFAGANRVAIQLIERSTPAFLNAFFRELAAIYAQETEQEAEADVLAATTGTSVLADFSTDAATTIGALVDAAVGIAKAVKVMPDSLYVSPDRWGQLNKLTDSSGRQLFPWVGNNPQNALGQTSLAAMGGQLDGLRIVMCPNFATNTALMGASQSIAVLEQQPIQLRSFQVSTLDWELGVYGYFATAIKYPLGFHSFTAT